MYSMFFRHVWIMHFDNMIVECWHPCLLFIWRDGKQERIYAVKNILLKLMWKGEMRNKIIDCRLFESTLSGSEKIAILTGHLEEQ